MQLTLIEHGTAYAPDFAGRQSLLLAGNQIVKIGAGEIAISDPRWIDPRDVLILRADTLDIVHLFARGRHLIQEGEIINLSKQEQQVQAGKE